MTAAIAAMLAAGAAVASGAQPLHAAWLREASVITRTSNGEVMPEVTPLGSTWKLFVYAYLVEQGIEAPAYRCGVPRVDGDEYCCEAGGSIDRDRALAKSCGRFFEPSRLHIEPAAWRAFWSVHVGRRATWVTELANLRPEKQVPVAALLDGLASVPPRVRAAASRALLPVVIDGYGRGVVAHVGGLLRVKTFTWSDPRRPNVSIGGAAGWLVDGTPVWFSSTGSSRSVLLEHAATLAGWLPAPIRGPDEEPCVAIAYFERYPIRSIESWPGRVPAMPGPLAGTFRVLFENGNVVVFTANGELTLAVGQGHPSIRGRLGLTEYVARVVDREADATVLEAARALAIVARTWTVRNAPYERGCYQVADSTRMQRVSPNAATAAARAAALFTDGLVLDNADVRYHRDTAAANVLAWTAAVDEARAGRTFDAILARAFPRASLGTVSGERECRRADDLDAWLAQVEPSWRRRLASKPGFEPPGALAVCALDEGSPYADRARMRIYVRSSVTRENRLSVAHEYVHLAFQFYPASGDERFVEETARSLVQ